MSPRHHSLCHPKRRLCRSSRHPERRLLSLCHSERRLLSLCHPERRPPEQRACPEPCRREPRLPRCGCVAQLPLSCSRANYLCHSERRPPEPRNPGFRDAAESPNFLSPARSPILVCHSERRLPESRNPGFRNAHVSPNFQSRDRGPFFLCHSERRPPESRNPGFRDADSDCCLTRGRCANSDSYSSHPHSNRPTMD